ncbi:MAG: hypothetical protein KKB66_20985 [Alphaproteobacteria bacterium]|jgi:hypothetical protein|nr:hypothetical protein [Alphaproteobacteria bacterium]MBU0804085.1 hypothetical protein [Alphaproteobacteria bacterium]MBU0872618.1 hypothetical protein [Alphaproteobacteria bacterium]MBU1403630.1 hypothetical protein [Alphaproteobacteria bacterium]MBU1593657.1 hypothetical protein [Alphaproteobacteria bacterium]
MILGMSVSTFTTLHVLISLVAIATGLIVVWGMLTANRVSSLTFVFLLTTVLTTLTGFLFPITAFTPALGVGIVSSLVLLVTLAALYAFRLRGPWRWVYVAGAVLSLYLNVFVLVVQSFLKVPALNALAPGGNEPPFTIAQGILLVVFILLGLLSLRRFHPIA